MTRYEGPQASASRWDAPGAMDDSWGKGALLYEEPRSRLMNMLSLSGLAAFLVIMAVVLFHPLVTWWHDPDMGGPMRFVLLVSGCGLVLVAAGLVMAGIRTMPFRVYERGVTRTHVPLRDGLAGRETFVPAEEVRRVTWETFYYTSAGPTHHFRFHLLDGTTYDVSGDHPGDVMPWLLRVLPCPVEGPE